MDDIFNGNDEVEFVITNGIRVNSLNTYAKIRELLFENGRDSYLLSPKNYPHGQFRADQFLAIFTNKEIGASVKLRLIQGNPII